MCYSILKTGLGRARNSRLLFPEQFSLCQADLPDGPLAVMCAHGERAATGASLLARAGRTDVTVLTGGPDDWAREHGRLDGDG